MTKLAITFYTRKPVASAASLFGRQRLVTACGKGLKKKQKSQHHSHLATVSSYPLSPYSFATGDTSNGETNCPKYKAAERSGMTVVAELRPPFIEAIVLR